MADGAQHAGDIDAAERETDIVAGPDDADQGCRETFLQRTKRDEGALQAIAADEDACGDEEGDERANLRHGAGDIRESGRDSGDHCGAFQCVAPHSVAGQPRIVTIAVLFAAFRPASVSSGLGLAVSLV
ncbi:hypothetical protein D9M72_514380 [compost metagenome]